MNIMYFISEFQINRVSDLIISVSKFSASKIDVHVISLGFVI